MLVDEQWRGVSGPAKDFVLQLLQLEPQKRLKVEQALQHPWLMMLTLPLTLTLALTLTRRDAFRPRTLRGHPAGRGLQGDAQ